MKKNKINSEKIYTILTKIDLCDKFKLEKIRKKITDLNKHGKESDKEKEIEHFLINGLVLVKNRTLNENQINNNNNKEKEKENLIYSIRKEKDFFRAITQFRAFDLKSNFGCECLVDKIKNKIFQELSKNLPKIYEENKQRISDCQIELQKFGTDYIYLNSNSDSSKLTYLNTLINHFVDDIYCKFSGKLNKNINKDTMAISCIKKIFYGFLDEKNSKSTKILASNSLSDEEIINVLKRSEGDKLSGFPEGDVIQMVLEKEIKRLKGEVKDFSEGIIEIVQSSLKTCLEIHFCRYPDMLEKIEEFLNVFTEKVNLKYF